MDRLKEQAFPLALAGAGVVLLVAFVFLIWKPLQAIGAQEEKVNSMLGTAQRIPSGDRFPSEERLEFKKREQAREKTELEQGIEFYDGRTHLFRLYFDDAERAPDYSAFVTRFNDELESLQTKYRDRFGISSEEPDSPPVLKGYEAQGTFEISDAMKRFWMIQAIFESCHRLGLDGLREVEFERQSARTPYRRSGEEEESPFITKDLDVTVRIDMRFGEVRDFLVSLFESSRVPFVDAKEIKLEKTEKTVIEEFTKLVHKVMVDPKDPQYVPPSYDQVIREPRVEVELELRALDWKGPRPKKEEEPEA